MMRRARRILREKILVKSFNKADFELAKLEWQGIQYYQDPTVTSICECTYQGIRRLWVIYNRKTKKTMRWIGSCCIKHFGIELLDTPSPKKILPRNNTSIYDWLIKKPKDQKKQDVNQDTNQLPQ